MLRRALSLWVVVDPLGTLPVMIAVSAGLGAAAARRLALRAALTAFAVLAGFMLLGRTVLAALEIPLHAFQIAGGLVLLLFALELIFADPKHERDLAAHQSPAEAAVFPLAIPSLASPGAMLTATLTAEEVGAGWGGKLLGLGLLGAVMLSALLILLAAAPLHRRIGDAGSALISRVMGMILAAVAVTEMLRGFAAVGWAIPAA
ncbi:MarC family protein [Rhodovulum sp. DZ06]|uniref:MarC family protein n=1 Tax=Rhodovulum sp. DZ06 TaxID=3425126 RepID=UPI003D345CE7